jgi:NaMN:DMB phosphoribosyltransferase
MPEPTSLATLAGSAIAVPMLTIAGVSLGLRADVLLAGFSGAVAAMTLLNSVPSTGDTTRELLRTTAKRVGVATGSAVTAGYTAPLVSLINGIPEALILGVAFVVGAGAMQLLPWLIERFGKGGAT